MQPFGNIQEFSPAGAYQWGKPVEQHEGMSGFRSARSTNVKRVTEGARLLADVLAGRTDPVFLREAMSPTHEVFVSYLRENYPGIYHVEPNRALGLRETMSVTDYQALFTDVLDRMYYGFYNVSPIPNMGLVKQHDLRDARLVSRYLLDGVVPPLTSSDFAAPPSQRALSGPVPQDNATYPGTNTAPIQYQPLLWQTSTAVNWRAFLNDDLGIFRDLANRLSIAGQRAIHKYITGLFFSTAGLNANLYKAGYTNLITTAYGAASNNPPLSAQGLQDAYKVLAFMKDSGGDPISPIGKVYLVHGPALAATANNLAKAMKVQVSVEGGNQNAQGFPTQFVETANWMMANTEPVLDQYMPIVMAGAAGNIPNTAWALVLDPNAQNRPCVELGFLNGYKTPQIFQKAPNTMRLGGGVDATLGDFDDMDQRLKIVTVFAGTQIDGRSTVGSTGAGS